jgi:hypothetical protein
MKNRSEKVIMTLFREFPQAVREKDEFGYYPIQHACSNIRSEKVMLKLIHEFPQVAAEKYSNACYLLNYACRHRHSERVILKILNEFPQAAKKQERLSWNANPLVAACQYLSSDRVVLALLNLNIMAVKHTYRENSPLRVAKRKGQSAIVIKVLEELTEKSYGDFLENRIDIPKIVTMHDLDNLRRQDTLQWVQNNSPMLIDGQYIQKQQSVKTVKDAEEEEKEDGNHIDVDGHDGFASLQQTKTTK